jgi:hypothetical protein
MNVDITPAAQPAESRAHTSQSQQPLASFPYPPLVFRQSTTTRFSDQQLHELIPIRDSSRIQNEHRTTQVDFHRGRPVSSRSRSRSPTPATRPLLYRDRSPNITTSHHESSSALGQAAGSRAVCNPAELERRLRLDKLRKEKNDYAVCVTCWLKDLSCNHQWPCSECKASGKPCAYVTCILGGRCPTDVKCPCYHTNKAIPQETPTRKLGSSMHLIALLNLKPSSLESYNMSKIQTRLQDPTMAPQIYLRLEPEIQHLLDQGQRFRDSVVRTLLRQSDKVCQMTDRGLKIKARFVVELVKEKK